MPIAAVDPNIQYARPIQVSSEPVNAYFTARELQQRNAYNQQRLGLEQQSEQDRIAQQTQARIAQQMKSVANLGKLDMGGIWHDEQEKLIDEDQAALTQMIKNHDPNVPTAAMKMATNLEGRRLKAQSYMDMQKQAAAQYAKDQTIDQAKFPNYWISKTAYNPDGSRIPLDQLDLAKAKSFNPYTDPGVDSIIDNSKMGALLGNSFKNSTYTIGEPTKQNGVVTGMQTTTETAKPYMRLNPVSGRWVVNRELVGAHPELAGPMFDRLRTKSGILDVVNDQIYQNTLAHPEFVAQVGREIAKLNAGKKPNDPTYIEPNSEDAVIVGKAMATNHLMDQASGNFSLKRTYRASGSGSGSGSSTKLNEAGLLDRLNGVMNQDPAYLQNNPVEGNPVSNRTDKAIGLPPGYTANVTPVLKGLNVGVDDKGKPVQAKAILVKKDDPGAIYIDYGDGKPAQRVTKQELPTWLNQISKYNKGLDPVTLNKLYPEKLTPPTAEPFPTIPTKTAPATTPLQAVKNAAKKAWASFKVKSK